MPPSGLRIASAAMATSPPARYARAGEAEYGQDAMQFEVELQHEVDAVVS